MNCRVGQMGCPDGVECPIHHGPVLGGESGARGQMRGASECDEFPHREQAGVDAFGEHHRDAGGEVGGPDRRQIVAVDQYLPVQRRLQPAQGAQQRRLAGAVGADQRGEFAASCDGVETGCDRGDTPLAQSAPSGVTDCHVT